MVLKSSLPEVPIEKLNLSFSGCGFLGIYHMGVACCFREYLPQICERQISGASAGALVAAALACNLNLGKCACHILEVAIKARHRALGPFHPNFNINEIMLNALNDVLPANAHELVNGKINISVTRVSDGQNCILSHFETRADLIQAILCSCFIPFWSGYIPPKFQGTKYMDGGLSKNLLILDENTITVSPFSGESDICPLDSTYNAYKINFSNTSISLSLENLYRLTRILFPPDPEVMGKMCQQGFQDALRYLQRNNRIACTRCIAVQSTYVVNEDEKEFAEPNEEASDEDEEEFLFKNSREMSELNKNLQSLNSSFNNLVDLDFKIDEQTRNELSDEEIDEELRKLVEFNNRMNNKRKDETLKEEFIQAMEQDFRHGTHQDNCKSCQNRKENLHKENLPENVNQAIQAACDKVNKGLINYIFKFRIMKIVSTLTVPYVLPFDITIAMLRRLRKLLPIVTNELSASLRRVILFVISLVNAAKEKEVSSIPQHLANFNYKVALTEFNYTDDLNNNASTKENVRLRKISTSSTYSVDSMYESEKPKMQKSNSFRMRRTNSIEDIRHKLKKICSNENLSLPANNTCNFNAPTHGGGGNTTTNNTTSTVGGQPPYAASDAKKLKRKSYAGNELSYSLRNIAPERRVSMLDFLGCKQPERVLNKLNLNFSIDLNDINSESTDLNHNLNSNIMNVDTVDSISQSRTKTDNDTPAPIALANNALINGINDIESQEQNLERFNSKIKELTSSKEALMAFHYLDDDNNMQIMEIYNVSDVENSGTASEDEAPIADDDSERFDAYDSELASNSAYDQSTFDRRERKKNVLFR